MIDLLPRSRVFTDIVRDPSDVEALVAIHAAGFRRGWDADEIENLLADETVFCIVLRRESLFGVRRILGFAMIRSVADQAEVLTIAVAPARRGRGYGRRILEEALRQLYRDHLPEIFLEVDEANQSARALYSRLGFVEVGRRKGYYRDEEGRESTALVLRLQLR
ncbi:GNAT family N-acetyltransferase [Kaistia dalseonensis]|uniref:Ribosomal-protein-alanine N-acetyltransferase n=1 Tax=Kaistia dalseonensis TaxID=410840 RepID=A0ABU0H590_9HYPH|nr:GNAT family N-acetyltransferase [Kaistia dalseonensis]MCX5494900.1 GNAT family N-acetyltransferase [Kaistia dalseonensis]MDQ0437481.1 ribosomal-protein-alanine N-acetyltransferase [Kaistia dalseonensis]